jgi:hypothetical protein
MRPGLLHTMIISRTWQPTTAGSPTIASTKASQAGGVERSMALTLVKGSFRIIGASPDGDSLRF